MTHHLHSLIKLSVLQGYTTRDIIKKFANSPDTSGASIEQEVSEILAHLTPEQTATMNKITAHLITVNTLREKIKLQQQISNLLEQMSTAEKKLAELSNTKIND